MTRLQFILRSIVIFALGGTLLETFWTGHWLIGLLWGAATGAVMGFACAPEGPRRDPDL
jgi:hypothetical protein